MASKFVCECGYTVRTNPFEGHGIYKMVSDNEIDKIDDSDIAKFVIDLWIKSQEAIVCKSCGDIYLWNSELKEYDQHKKAPN